MFNVHVVGEEKKVKLARENSKEDSTVPSNSCCGVQLNDVSSGKSSVNSEFPLLKAVDRQTSILRKHGKFTVTPVRVELLNSLSNHHNSDNNNTRNGIETFEFQDSGNEQDSYTQNSITALLSSKFKDIQKKIRQYSTESPRFRKRIVSRWESLNYDICESELYVKENGKKRSKKSFITKQFLLRWLVMFATGVATAILAAGIHVIVEEISHLKFGAVKKYLDDCDKNGCYYIPVFIWVSINIVFTLTGALLVAYIQPKAAGSGIPLIKSYLNGVKIPGLLDVKCFIAKVGGVICSILGGLACGKEGPMAHSGGILAAGFGQGRSRMCCKAGLPLCESFRTDHEIRDFVAGGAASGVSAAFGAPIGGTLFSVEEAASFWNQELTWRVFFSAMISCFGTNILLSLYAGNPTKLSSPGLIRFNIFDDLSFDLIEIPVFFIMAVIGGLIGALFVVLNYKLTVFRQKFFRKKWMKVLEAVFVCTVSALVSFFMLYILQDCTDKEPSSHHAVITKMYCTEGKHISFSSVLLTTPEGALKALLHDPYESFSVVSLVVFMVIFFILSVWTYGLSVSSGVFIPSLAIGAAWGRLIGIGVVNIFPDYYSAHNTTEPVAGHWLAQRDIGKYALIGAAAQLGGILRTTISLTIMIVECTGDISFGLPIMLVLMISKWMGDFITTGLYDMNVEVSGIPLLPWEPPPLCDNVKASEIMSQPVLALKGKEKVGHIMDILRTETFCGFPVVEPTDSFDASAEVHGKLKGLILKSQLLVLLKNKIYIHEGLHQPRNISLTNFRDAFPQHISLKDLDITEEEKEYYIDIKPFMNPNPFVITANYSLPRLFKLFRGLGLRHLIVVNENNEATGMITRKDLAKFRAEARRGIVKIEHLKIEDV